MVRAHVVLTAAVLVSSFGCSRKVNATVGCFAPGPTISTGLMCTIERAQVIVTTHVCWDVHVTCENGTSGQGRECGDVRPGAGLAVMMPYSAFNGALDGCDRAAAVSVSGLTVAAQ